MRFIPKLSRVVFLCLLIPALAFAQADIAGKVTDASTKGPLIGATVQIEGTTMGAATGPDGTFNIANVPAGTHRLRVSFIGYLGQTRTLTVGTSNVTANFALEATVLTGQEVIVEVNRAKDRETPVAFTNIRSEQIDERMHGQDAPLLVKGTPGVYSYSPDGVGNGESKLYVRGFDQNYVQVLINGVPTNDPESNSVYWSNWGSVSSSASSIQLQRGAGSTLYGAGSFGGSFNIVTQEAPAKSSYGLRATVGDPLKSSYGVELNTGLYNNNRFATSFTLDRIRGEGNRIGARYEGVNYYLSQAWYINDKQSLKFVLHGAPQEHGYSFSGDISFFKLFGFEASPSNFLARAVASKLPGLHADYGATANYGLLDGSRELKDPKFVALAHNFFHKPQAELHYAHDFSEKTQWRATAFYSKGRGGGSSLNSAANITFNRKSLNSYTFGGATAPIRGSDGAISNVDWAREVWLRNAFQRISYSFHQQGGLLTSMDTQLGNMFKLTVGGEGRYWTADHPGHFVNLYGKQSVNATYARRSLTGAIGTFSRQVFQGDVDGPDSDYNPFDLFSWSLSNNDPTFRTQYRNYKGTTPQITLFTQGNWRLTDKLNALTTLQYVWYQYKLDENMPSENSIGQEVTVPAGTTEGPTGNGKFLMRGTNNSYYEFTLVQEKRSRGFFQPKVGLNYNLSENFNAFGSFAHVERFVDLGIYYNQGRVFPEAEDEKSNQFELGLGWQSSAFRAKINGYTMTWENKGARIQDLSKAGQPGYDRNGFRTELVGTSRHNGAELEMTADVGRLISVKGLELRGSLTYMDNKWTKVLTSVQTDANLGALQEDTNLNGKLDAGEDQDTDNKLDENRRAFNTSARDRTGVTDVLYFVELKDKHVASKPQTILSGGLTYSLKRFAVGFDVNYYTRDFALDGETYVGVDGNFVGDNFVYVFDNELPSRAIVDAQAAYRYDVMGLRGNVSVQVLNVFDKEYLADSDRFGVIPGILRSVRLNVSTGL